MDQKAQLGAGFLGLGKSNTMGLAGTARAYSLEITGPTFASVPASVIADRDSQVYVR